MKISHLMSQLRHLDIKIWVENDRLRYDAPADTLTDELRAEIIKRKKGIIEFLRSAQKAKHSSLREIKRFPRNQAIPLSFAQQRLWFLDQLEPANPSYNMPMAVRLTGRLDVSSLQRSLNKIVSRHESLRTIFPSVEGQPKQQVMQQQPFELAKEDLSSLPESERELVAQHQAKREAMRPFDLARGPLVRGRLMQLDDHTHILVLCMHHIVSDGWSMGLFFNELSALYTAFINGQPSLLPDLPVQYADFALWQRHRLQGEVLERELEYWKKQLGYNPPTLDLPTDKPRPATQTYQGACEDLKISGPLLEDLRELSHREEATLFMTMFAAFNALLYRYTGQEDILVGTPIVGRNYQEIEELIGFFVNTIVLHTDLSGRPSFRTLLSRVRRTALEAYQHQELPFEKLVEELHPKRDLSRNPLFQVFFNMGDPSDTKMTLPQLKVESFHLPLEFAKFDMTVYCFEEADRLSMRIAYNTDLFRAATIQQMLGHYQNLLAAVVKDPDCPISVLPLFSKEERSKLKARCNEIGPTNPYREFKPVEIEKTIPERFSEQVRQYPEHIAIKTQDEEWSYSRLEVEANRIAHAINSQTGADSQNIALLFEHSADTIAAMLGVLKAGCAYVPLDPSYPQQRLAFIVQDSQTSVIITNGQYIDLAHRFGDGARSIIDVDNLKSDVEPFTSLAKPDSLAYILCTSGSTGQPKGVMQNHRNVLHHIRIYSNSLHIAPEDRLTLLPSYTFDGAVMDIFGALLNGATLYQYNIRDRGLAALPSWLDSEQVTIYHSTPSVYRYFIGMLDKDQILSHLRFIVLGGEEVFRNDFELYKMHFSPHCLFINGLGPSESTLALQYFMNHDVKIERHAIPAGYPVAGTEIVLIDEMGEEVDFYGEIGIRSDHVALGYWHRPELTQKAFPSDAAHTPRRTYLTGDMGRMLPDGSIEFAGRKDLQVKIRGIRIELGEINTTLTQHPDVHQAVTIAHKDSRGEKQLVAYIMPSESNKPSVHGLRDHLRQRLADFMIPAAYVILDTLPLTPNGKIDYRALPEPLQFESEETYVAPRNNIEKQLAGIWTDLLNLECIGIHDNFFHLGGHSLLATQVISRVNKTFGVLVPVVEMFEHPTVDEFANELILRMQQEGFEKEPSIKPAERKAEMPLSFAQQRLWFLDQLDPDSPAYNMPLAIEIKGELNQEALQKSIHELVRRHESLRSHFEMRDGQPVQLIDAFQQMDIPVIDLSKVADSDREKEVQRLVTEDSLQPFDLTHGPLLRVKLLRITEADHIMLLTMHHIVSDGWSMGVLFHELTVLYESYMKDRPSPLPGLAVQYADFAVWQRNWLSGQVLDSQMSYWKQQLSGELSVLNLPTDYPYPAIQTFNGARQSIQLSKELSESLKALSHCKHVTLFMTLLAAFKVLLHRYTGQEDIIVGSPVANRNRAEIEGLIGFFVNMLVLRSRVSDTQSFRELLAQVRETTLGAYAHQDLPFEKLVDDIVKDRDLSRSALFQVTFALQNAPIAPLELVGLQLKPVELESQTTRFELEVHIREQSGRLRVIFIYNRDLFAPPTIERMINHYRILLQQIISNPNLHISELSLLTESETHQLLVEWNDTKTEYQQDKCIHDLFENQVARIPDAVALLFENQKMTYLELNTRANQLAHYLKKKGVESGTLVGICIERSIEMVIGLFGILKVGAAYVPIDPSYPINRIGYMLLDSEVKVLLTQEKLLKDLPKIEKIETICLDVDLEKIKKESRENIRHRIPSDNLAYVIYTSGSTGKPKGVCISHSSLVNHMNWIQRVYSIDSIDIILQKTPYSFDASVWEFYATLLVGGRLVIAKTDGHKDPLYLIELINKHKITILQVVPSLLKILLETKKFKTCSSLKRVFCGGEPLNKEIKDQFFSVLNASLVNLYGPTECTIDSTHYLCSKEKEDAIIPIGRPIDNTQIFILDSTGSLASIGIPGELHIGGAGLARGYLNRPDLTAKRFILNPFSQKPDARLYKTGDLVRYLPDGNIEFLGRKDDQVKIRGFRIEPGEIESVLAGHPAVRESVVLAREDQPGDKRLVAYVVLSSENEAGQAQADKLQGEHICQWQRLYEETYSETPPPKDLTFNIIGWNSSYTGLPIQEEEMREWVEHTVDRIISLQPSRVLEIGCGTGLLLSRIAPFCVQYCGTDFSQIALEYIQQIKRSVKGLEHVLLLHRMADDFEGIDAGTFDTVILNSVVQYFPNIEYVLKVMEGAIDAVESGGFIFVGDVRSLPLLEAYHASVQLYQAPSSLSLMQLQQRIRQRMVQEEELVIDPDFFIALKKRLPRISHVQIQLKRGRHKNELTQFRYDVILYIGAEAFPPVEIPWIDWQMEKSTLSDIRQLLKNKKPEIIGLQRVPNARIQAQIKTLKWLTSPSDNQTVGELREALLKFENEGVDPEHLWALSDELPYAADIRWSNSGSEDCFDVVFKRDTSAKEKMSRRGIGIPEEKVPLKPWNEYANNPMYRESTRELKPQLRNYLSQKLPDYMVPAAFVFLDTLPLMPNGKVDKRALPAPDSYARDLSGQYVEPCTPTEQALAGIWSYVLGEDGIGIHDNFFHLGGHSLLATQVISRVCDTLGLELPLRSIFEFPTIANLARHIDTMVRAAQGRKEQHRIATGRRKEGEI